MRDELITVEYAGQASRQVGPFPMHDVRAWWVIRDEGTEGRVKVAAGRELKKHVRADHVEFAFMDMDTYSTPHINAMMTFRVLTAEQFDARAELRSRRYTRCDGCADDSPGQLVHMYDDVSGQPERALCYACWRPLAVTVQCKVLHWIDRRGRLMHV